LLIKLLRLFLYLRAICWIRILIVVHLPKNDLCESIVNVFYEFEVMLLFFMSIFFGFRLWLWCFFAFTKQSLLFSFPPFPFFFLFLLLKKKLFLSLSFLFFLLLLKKFLLSWCFALSGSLRIRLASRELLFYRLFYWYMFFMDSVRVSVKL
jgi:hypothetical protein